MKINLLEIYKEKYFEKFLNYQGDDFKSLFSSFDFIMWDFAGILLEKEPDKVIYDTEKDAEFIKPYIELYEFVENRTFTPKQFFDFLISQS